MYLKLILFYQIFLDISSNSAGEMKNSVAKGKGIYFHFFGTLSNVFGIMSNILEFLFDIKDIFSLCIMIIRFCFDDYGD